MKHVLVTGAGGFIARHVVRACSRRGWKTTGISRGGGPVDGFNAVHRARLGDPLPDTGDRIDAVVHAAVATGQDEYALNVGGTSRWLEEAAARGARLQILLSSLSAAPDALADYGRAKFALEERFTAAKQVAFRLGVVIGDGGMFERIRRSLGAPVVPLLDGGRGRVYILGIDFLAEMIAECIENDGERTRGEVWNVQQPEAYTLRALMEGIRDAWGLRCRFVPVPSLPVLWALTVLEKLPLSLPVSATNIRGLRQSRNERHDSDFARFGTEPRSLRELVARAVALSRG